MNRVRLTCGEMRQGEESLGKSVRRRAPLFRPVRASPKETAGARKSRLLRATWRSPDGCRARSTAFQTVHTIHIPSNSASLPCMTRMGEGTQRG